MSADVHLDPEAVERLARLARRIATDLDAPAVPPGAAPLAEPVHRATAELVAFAGAAERAARRIRDADRAAADGFRGLRRR